MGRSTQADPSVAAALLSPLDVQNKDVHSGVSPPGEPGWPTLRPNRHLRDWGRGMVWARVVPSREQSEPLVRQSASHTVLPPSA